MKRLFSVLTLLALVLGAASCTLLSNDPAIAARVLTQASYTGGNGSPKQVSPKSFTTASPDFTGSAYAADAAGLTDLQLGLVLGDVSISQGGQQYSVSGTLNYALGITSMSTDVVFTAVLFGTGISIIGDDYFWTADVDLEEVITFTPDGSGGGIMSGTVTGTVNNTVVSNPVSFSF